MILTMCELREKDVINICDGKKLGYICDVEIEADCGRITAIYVSDRFFSLNGSKNCIKLKWDTIRCIGEDTVLADAGKICRSEERCREEKRRKSWLFEL